MSMVDRSRKARRVPLRARPADTDGTDGVVEHASEVIDAGIDAVVRDAVEDGVAAPGSGDDAQAPPGRLQRLTGGAPPLPLIVLFGLNAVDELDRAAFGVLTPEIRDDFGLSNQGILSLVSAFAVVVIFLSIPIAHQADRRNRVQIARGGAVLWASFSILTGLAPVVAVLLLARIGSGLGKAVNTPTHNSLLADYYPPAARARVYYVHGMANTVGQFTAPTIAGLLAVWFTWRTPFVVFAIPTVVFIVLSLRMREPVRGRWDRSTDGDTAADEAGPDTAVPFREAWRVLWQVKSLRRFYYALPFLFASLAGIGSLANLFWEDVYGLSPAQRGVLETVSEGFQLAGIVLGAVYVQKVLSQDPKKVVQLLAGVSVVIAGGICVMALSPVMIGSIAGRIVMATLLVALFPGILTVGSMAIPARVRALGFSSAGVFAIPGIIFLPVAGALGDTYGLRAGMLILVPVYLTAAAIIATGAKFVDRDIERAREDALAAEAWRSAAPAEHADDPPGDAGASPRDNGRAAGGQTAVDTPRGMARHTRSMLSVRNLSVAYGQTQVLFDVDLDVGEGEIVALLGTNGAGKSTVLKAVSGLLPVMDGSVRFDGQDITHRGPRSTAMSGIAQVPGGRGVFPSLTVTENLRAASWLFRGDKGEVKRAKERSLELFPRLAERLNTPAGSLSGGEQQMLSLSQAFIARPKLLMIDELSLGLAPTIVERLVETVREIHSNGTTILLVEQSVNTALRLAERAVFLEKGEVRFEGPTAELLERTDILRSVYLKGASAGPKAASTSDPTESDDDGTTALAARPSPAEVLAAPVVLRVDGLTKSYGGITAVSDVSFSLHHGQILGLIGPNGAGKTTVLDLISGFQASDSGVVRVDDHDVSDWPAYARARTGLGRMFQDARLFGSLTVEEAISAALESHVEVREPFSAILGMPALRDSEERLHLKVDELIELVRLGAFRDKFVNELSTGSRRMVEIAALLGIGPRVLLLDEPSSGIAQREAEALGPILLDVQRELDASLLVIEHSMPLLTSVADHLVALDSGQFVTEGEPDEVLSHPHVVASYLGGATVEPVE